MIDIEPLKIPLDLGWGISKLQRLSITLLFAQMQRSVTILGLPLTLASGETAFAHLPRWIWEGHPEPWVVFTLGNTEYTDCTSVTLAHGGGFMRKVPKFFILALECILFFPHVFPSNRAWSVLRVSLHSLSMQWTMGR